MQVTPAALGGIANSHTSHPTDSHPPLPVRLAALGVTMETVAAASLDVAPSDGAIGLMGDIESREEALSDAYQYLLGRRLGIAAPEEQPAAG